MLDTEQIKDIEDSLKNYPLLKLHHNASSAHIDGMWAVAFNGIVIEEFQIKIEFLPGYPGIVPLVYETGGKIAKHRDRHFTPPNWSACLFVEDSRWEAWPLGTSFLDFLQIPVYNFFLAQATFNEYGEFRDGEYSHGDNGIKEYYLDKLGVKDPMTAWNLMFEAIAKQAPDKCPCKSGKAFANCHKRTISTLTANIPYPLLKRAYDLFFKEIRSDINGWNIKKGTLMSRVFSLSPEQLQSMKKTE